MGSNAVRGSCHLLNAVSGRPRIRENARARVLALVALALVPGCACDEPPSDGERAPDTSTPIELVPVLGALCDYIERCPDDLVPIATRNRAECIDVMYYFLTCQVDFDGAAVSLTRVDLPLTAETMAGCAAFFSDLTCGELGCDDGGPCASDPDRLACAALFEGVGSSDDDDEDDQEGDGTADDGGECVAHEDCPAGRYCQPPTYSPEEEQTLCARCVGPLSADDACVPSWDGLEVPCEDGLVCGPNWDDDRATVCTPPRGGGEGCLADADCAGGFCVPSLSRCDDTGFEGDACAYPLACRPGLTCIQQVCEVAVPPGGACTSSDECEGRFCDTVSQTCGTPDGGACTVGNAHRCLSSWCDPQSATCAPRPPPSDEGEPCVSSVDCIDGLACDVDNTCYRTCTDDDDCPGQQCEYQDGLRCVPRAEEGSGCDSDADCDTRFCDDELRVCVPPPTVGTPCELGTFCGLALTCQDGACAPRAGPDEPCAGYDGCLQPYICLEGRCELFPLTCGPAPVGERCAALRVCEDAGYCDVTDDFTCAPRLDEGDVCIGFPADECHDSLFCDRSLLRCVPRVGAGAPCDTSESCVLSAVCAQGTCVAVQGGRRACDWEFDCNAGEYCTDADELCVPRAGAGSACDPYDGHCATGLRCDEDLAVCAPLPSAGSPCDDGACAVDAWCEAGLCVARDTEGEACTGYGSVPQENSCGVGLQCAGEVCTALGVPGTRCTNDDTCASGLCDLRVEACVDDRQCL